MDSRLLRLLEDYRAAVREAVELMARAGIPKPATAVDWVAYGPRRAALPDGASFYKHGIGCSATLSSGPVDFDFGEHGETDGFDLWRLTEFWRARRRAYGFASEAEVRRCFEAAAAAGEVVAPRGSTLFYLEQPRS